VIHFWAPWSDACKQLDGNVDLLSLQFDTKTIRFAKVEAEGVPELSLQFDIKAVPTFIFIHDGSKFDRLDGFYPAELAKKVRQYANGLIPKHIEKSSHEPVSGSEQQVGTSTTSKGKLEDRLKKLTNQSTMVLFMKGTRDAPQCGFSRQILQLLDNVKADYSTFDILSDETIRQGLKEWSKWPTYPQLYLNGELLGGLDIVREQLEDVDFVASLPKKDSLNDRLKKLINKAPVVIFIKGSPQSPQCKFSRALVELLNGMPNVKYDHFDILSDEDVRQGLKEYSRWPTYPQVYANGQLIGGLDIVKELKENDELEKVLLDGKE